MEEEQRTDPNGHDVVHIARGWVCGRRVGGAAARNEPIERSVPGEGGWR